MFISHKLSSPLKKALKLPLGFSTALLIFSIFGCGTEAEPTPTLVPTPTLSFPPAASSEDAEDMSGLREVKMGELAKDIIPAMQGAFDGGAADSKQDVTVNNILGKDDQQDNKRFDVPSNGAPSPLFGALAFTQQFLRFEEFGTSSLADAKVDPETALYLPVPADAASMPESAALDTFLKQDIYPAPTRWANTVNSNPWQTLIESFLGRDLDTPPIEGRPPGEGWAHQRWEEFAPLTYFNTAQTGARTNTGLRDDRQTHAYSVGEFALGGLYHNTAGKEGFAGTTKGLEVTLHPNMPVQEQASLWTFDGTFPPKLLKVRYGEPVIMRHHNALPVDVSANRGFGLHTLTTHEHNGHNPAESDGFANAFFFPGQFYDYRWPVTLAGHDSINVDANDPRAGSPDGHGGITKLAGDWRETMSTHWFHDHMLDFTAQNVYKGNVAMMNYYSAIDRGNESIEDGVNLRLPSGSALDWGNRDYDVNLLLAEKAWDASGQLWFNPFNQRGFIGDVMTVNWLYKPYMEVRARRYRFRILNGSVSRYFKLALVNQNGVAAPFHMVANDGNIMEHSVVMENGEMPTLGVAERYDIVIDFAKFEDGDKLHLVNMLQHKNGQSTDTIISVEDIVSGAYQAQTIDDDNDGIADRWSADPVVGRFMEFRVVTYTGQDKSLDPADYVEGKKQMIPVRRPTEDELGTALHRTFEFERQATDENPWVIETDGGKGFNMDPRRLSAAPQKNSGGLEVWRLINSGTWSHPIHIHFEEGIILRRDGKAPPPWEKYARKDVYRLGPQPDSGDMVEIALRFREFAGTFMEHCHNTQHEDHAMLLRWDIENPGQTLVMPSPIPSWDGVSYVDTHALPTFRSGDAVGQYGPDLDDQALEIWLKGMEIEEINMLDMEIGDALNPTEDERAVGKIPLRSGINIDTNGVEREVFFVLHDISNRDLATEYGVAWAGALVGTPEAATSEASYDAFTDTFIFFGDLPNPVTRTNPNFVEQNDPNMPAQRADNTYSPLRRVKIDGKDVIVNAFFINWGSEDWEQLRIDVNCNPTVEGTFPDDPPNTSCMYNGVNWGGDTGHAVEINVDTAQPYVRMKLHKSWTEDSDYLPYYIVVDSFPAGPANAMGVIYVPKHEFLGQVAVPLIQWLPPAPLNTSYPPSDVNSAAAGVDLSMQLSGGGPLGGQIGLPSYFMPEVKYSPMWHIGFAHWNSEVATTDEVFVVKGLDELKALRDEGKVMIHEWPGASPAKIGSNDYNFDSLNPPHVVNCPTPVTIDMSLHRARKLSKP
ncbi:MAG: FtsP/CotA-like multicopper oxidase with cupredoxin domain [Paraglaciecola sp.]|jgi:FtsP/CotA-like multicopper oxidase with cupredoxin domain